MRAMILAGGLSTRLYPLTKAVPKPCVPVGGEPISGHVMRWLASHGYDEVAINVFYLADAVRAAFGDGSRYGVALHYLDEPELTGSAGALKQMEGWFDGTFVVVGCDEFPCSDSNSVSFKVDDSWFHDARHFILHGTPFRPDAVAAAVPPVVNKCEVTYYGWRWRPISRTIDLWPRLLEAQCVPINLDNGNPISKIDGMPTTPAPAPAVTAPAASPK